MTHRGPLVTLAGLVVAFGIFFGINLANSAPHQEVAQAAASVCNGSSIESWLRATASEGELNPDQTDVNADGENLTAQPVEGNADI
jgi:FlaG/FlaF family flagellin (archaellin)